ncbi:MAG TPA: hypothetical protein VH621_06695 [Nitrososphaera sp.]
MSTVEKIGDIKRALKVRVHKNVLIRESLLNKIFDYDPGELHG